MRFQFNEKKAAQAAAHLLKLNGGKLNHMVLIKLLFLADRVALLKNERPITGASMVSMDKGPVLSEVLDFISEGTRGNGSWAEHISPSSNFVVTLKIAEPETDELSRFELRVLEKVYEKFGKMDKWDLIKWLHDNIPEWTDPKGSALPIEYAEVLRKNDVSEPDIQRIREDAEVSWAVASFAK